MLRLGKLAIVMLAAAMFYVAPAHAQATRTWVSGVGDDANPCSRTAPCKTFAGAISKTAAGGEIDCLDPGGFGTLTITKAITIDCGATLGSVLASGTVGFNINAGPADKVILRNLSINGTGITLGTTGINFIAGGALTLQNVNVSTFSGYCVNFQPSVRANLVVIDSNLENCAQGGIISSAASGGVNRINLVNTTIHRSGAGLTLSTNTSAAVIRSFINNNPGGGVIANGTTVSAELADSSISNNQVYGVSAQSGQITIANNLITLNNGPGLTTGGTGQIVSFGNNRVADNSPNGTPTSTVLPE